MIEKLDIFNASENDTRAFIKSMRSGSVELQPDLPLTHYEKEPYQTKDDNINKLKVYPQPPAKNPLTIASCPSSRPNYAKEEREAAEAAEQAAALAEQYAEEAKQAAYDIQLQSTLDDDTLILYLEVIE